MSMPDDDVDHKMRILFLVYQYLFGERPEWDVWGYFMTRMELERIIKEIPMMINRRKIGEYGVRTGGGDQRVRRQKCLRRKKQAISKNTNPQRTNNTSVDTPSPHTHTRTHSV